MSSKANGFEYKTVDTRTAAGLAEAERLQSQGFKVISHGLFLVTMERSVKAVRS